MNRPFLSLGLATVAVSLVVPIRAQNPATERFALLGVPARKGTALEVRLLWLPKSGWLPDGGFALYRAKGEGPLKKLATLKPDATLLPADLKAKAAVGAGAAKLVERPTRARSSLTAFREFKTTLEAPTARNLPLALVRKQASGLASVKNLEPIRKPQNVGKKAEPTAADEAEGLRSQIALAVLTDRARAKSLALAFDDPEASEGDSVRYVLRGLDAGGAELPETLGSATVLVRAADATPPPPDPSGFSAVQLDQDSAAIHWEDPSDAEQDKLVLPHYDLFRDETKRNPTPILLTSHETASGEAASLVSFQDDKLALGAHTYKLTLTDAFGRTSAPVATGLTMADLRVPAPLGGALARYELDRTTLGRLGALRRFVRVYWAAPADGKPVVFDLTRIDADNPATRTVLTTAPIPGDPAGAGNMTLATLIGLTGDGGLLADLIAAATPPQRAKLTHLVPTETPRPLVEERMRAVLSAMLAGDVGSEFPDFQSRLDALSARIRTTTDDSAPADRYFRYELTASYAQIASARRTVPTLSAPVGVPLTVAPAAPTASGAWTRNVFFDAGTLSRDGLLRNDSPAHGAGAFVKPKVSVRPVTRPSTVTGIPAELGGTVALSWNAVPQTVGMRYRIYRAVATGFFPEGVSVGQTGVGIGRHVTVSGGTRKLAYYSQYNNLKDSDYLLLGSTADTTWTDSLPPSHRCVYFYKVEAVNRWGVAGARSAPLTVTAGATLPPSAPNLVSVKPKTVENADGALALTFSANAIEERVVEYRILRKVVPVTTQVSMVAPSVRVASLGQIPPAPSGVSKPRLSQLVGGKQLAPQGPEATRLGFPSARFGVVSSGGGFRAIQKQSVGSAVLASFRNVAEYTEVGKVTAPLGASAASLTFTDTTAKPGNEYAYRLVAVNDDTVGSRGSNTIDGRPFVKTLKPTGGAATWDAATRTVRLSWSAVPGAGGYFVRRKLGGGAPLQLGALSGNPPSTTFDDPDARAGRTYTYLVYASDASGGLSDPLALNVTTTAETEALPDGPTRTPGNGTKLTNPGGVGGKPTIPKVESKSLGTPKAAARRGKFGETYFLSDDKTLAVRVEKAAYSIDGYAIDAANFYYCKPAERFVKLTLSVKNATDAPQPFDYQSVTAHVTGSDGSELGETKNWKALDTGKLANRTLKPGEEMQIEGVVVAEAEAEPKALILSGCAFDLTDAANPVSALEAHPEQPAALKTAVPLAYASATVESVSRAGSTFTAKLSVRNATLAPLTLGPKSLTLELFDEDGDRYDALPVGLEATLAPGESVSVSVAFSAPASIKLKQLKLREKDSRVYLIPVN